MSFYESNPNPACRISLPADYPSIKWTKPISRERDLTARIVDESAKREALEQMGFDL